MTDLKALAEALSGATRPCPKYCPHGEKCGGFHSALNACLSCSPTCATCHGSGQVYVLGDLARKPCPYPGSLHLPNCVCGGRGWVTTLVRGERCAFGSLSVSATGLETIHEADCRCGGSGIVYRPDVGLVIEVLEEAGYITSYVEKLWIVYKLSLKQDRREAYADNPSVLVAAARVLGIGTEVGG